MEREIDVANMSAKLEREIKMANMSAKLLRTRAAVIQCGSVIGAIDINDVKDGYTVLYVTL